MKVLNINQPKFWNGKLAKNYPESLVEDRPELRPDWPLRMLEVPEEPFQSGSRWNWSRKKLLINLPNKII